MVKLNTDLTSLILINYNYDKLCNLNLTNNFWSLWLKQHYLLNFSKTVNCHVMVTNLQLILTIINQHDFVLTIDSIYYSFN